MVQTRLGTQKLGLRQGCLPFEIGHEVICFISLMLVFTCSEAWQVFISKVAVSCWASVHTALIDKDKFDNDARVT